MVIVDLLDYEKIKTEDWWWFKQKDEMIMSLIKNKKLNILEIGGNVDSRFLADIPNRYVIDIDRKSLEKIKCFKKYCLDVQKPLPFEKDFFDFVILADILEHVDNGSLVIRNVNAILKKDGILIITVPALKFIYSYHDVALSHKRRYYKNELKGLLPNYKIIRMQYWNFFLSPLIICMRLIKKIINSKGTDVIRLPKIINKLLEHTLGLENILLNKGLNFPFGLTIILVAKKTN